MVCARCPVCGGPKDCNDKICAICDINNNNNPHEIIDGYLNWGSE
jgi:hypothetical protein